MKRFPIYLILLLLVGSMVAGNKKSRTNSAKSDYLFLQAEQAISQGNDDAAYEMLSRAHELNPDDPDLQGRLAQYAIMLCQDSLEAEKAMGMLTNYCDHNPTDFMAWWKLAILTTQGFDRDRAIQVWQKMHALFPDREEVTSNLARITASSMEPQDMRLALSILDTLETTQGNSPELATRRTEILYLLHDTTAMVQLAKDLVASAPKSVNNNIYAGSLLSALGYPEALTYFDQACTLDPTNGQAVYARAEYYQTMGDSVQYDREILRALEMVNLEVETKLGILKTYVQEIYADSLRRPQVSQMLERLQELHPHEPQILLTYASFLMAEKQYGRAAEKVTSALDLEPMDSLSWELLVSLHFQNKDDARALETLDRALTFFPTDASLHLMRGGLLTQKDQPEQGRKEVFKAMELLDPENLELQATCFTTLADSYVKSEMLDSAYKYYEKALLYDPENALLMNNLAYQLAVQGQDLDRALTLIEKAASTLTDDDESRATYLDTHAWVLFKRKDYAKAREIMDQVLEIEMEEPSAEVFEHAGDIYFMDGEPDKALDFWKKALKLTPESDLLKRKVKNKTYFYK